MLSHVKQLIARPVAVEARSSVLRGPGAGRTWYRAAGRYPLQL